MNLESLQNFQINTKVNSFFLNQPVRIGAFLLKRAPSREKKCWETYEVISSPNDTKGVVNGEESIDADLEDRIPNHLVDSLPILTNRGQSFARTQRRSFPQLSLRCIIVLSSEISCV